MATRSFELREFFHLALLRDPAYQEKLARTMFEDIRRYYEKYQALQKDSRDEQAAAGAVE